MLLYENSRENMNKGLAFNSCSRHVECHACGKRIGMEYQRTEHEISFCDELWAIDKRKCKDCDYVDFSARSKDNDCIVVLSAPGTKCCECNEHARVTVVNPGTHDDEHFHFCEEEASEALKLISKHIDGHRQIHGNDLTEQTTID